MGFFISRNTLAGSAVLDLLWPSTDHHSDAETEHHDIVILGVAFNASSYMSETLRGALSSVNKGQMEACLACGMTRWQGFCRIVLPQAMRVAVPGLSNNFCGYY